MSRALNRQADRIEAVLSSFGIEAQVFAGQVLPQVVSHQLQLAPGQRLRAVEGLHRELALALQVAGVMITSRDGHVAIEVPRLPCRPIRLAQILRSLKAPPPAHSMLLGLSNQGTPLMLYMPSPQVAHVLIAGMTGCGKSELLRTMLVSLTMWAQQRAVGIYIVDPKLQRKASLATLPGVLHAVGIEGAPAILEQLLRAMDERDASGYNTPRLYLVVDELADMVLVGGRAIEVALTRLVQRGRGAGIHVIASTQRPSRDALQGIMKANFPVRICGAVNSALEASIATGLPGSGAERLLGKGDMLLAHHGQLVRFQACITSREDIERLDYTARAGGLLEAAGDVLERLRERLSVRRPGRPSKGASEPMIQFAVGRLKAQGTCSQRELRRWHIDKHQSDINPPRAKAAIQEARSRLGLRFS